MNKRLVLIKYINKIKLYSAFDIFSVINPTLIMNPYPSKFPNRVFNNEILNDNKLKTFFNFSFKLYKNRFKELINYIKLYQYYKKYYKKDLEISENKVIIDLFVNINLFNKNGFYEDNYFYELNKMLDKQDIKYIYLIRLVSNDYTKYNNFFKELNKDTNEYLFEFDYINYKDIFLISLFILIYPFLTLRLLQNEKSDLDKVYNRSLLRDISSLQFDSVTRYFFAKKLSKNNRIKKIYTWFENQSLDRAFNYGIKSRNNNIKIIACQPFINYKNFFNSIIYDEDLINNKIIDKILVNGKAYIKWHSTKIEKGLIPSFRYRYILEEQKEPIEQNILVLGSYFPLETKKLIEAINNLDYPITFKSHPSLQEKEILKQLSSNIKLIDKPLSEIFPDFTLIISTASGTLLEAIACGKSVITIESKDTINMNPLCRVGKGFIWDSIYEVSKIETSINKLINIRKTNPKIVKKVSNWYKKNYFTEINDENIKKIFQSEEINL